MNCAELFGLDDNRDDEKSGPEKILSNIEEMHAIAQNDYRESLQTGPLTKIQYSKGKVQALQEVLEMLATGKIPK